MSQQQPHPADESMTTVTAAVVQETKGPFDLEELELDEIRPNEVRVRLTATGVCHTDAVVRDGVYPTPLPAVLGHEGAGIVEAVGSYVTTVGVGDHVVLSAAYCGHCLQCRAGHMAYCENLFAEDFGGRRTSDGTTSLKTGTGESVSSHFFGQSSFSTYANVVESSVIPVDRSVPLEKIAFFGCGRHADRRRIDPQRASSTRRLYRSGFRRRRCGPRRGDGSARVGMHDDRGH